MGRDGTAIIATPLCEYCNGEFSTAKQEKGGRSSGDLILSPVIRDGPRVGVGRA